MPPWDQVRAFLDSAFVTSAVGAGAGAWLGALAAQRIAARSKAIDDARRQIRNTKAAITLASTIFNAVAAFKKQHAKELCESHKNDLEQHVKWLNKKDGSEFVLTPRLTVLPRLALASTHLQQLTYAQIDAVGRVIYLVAQIADIGESLNNVITQRNEFIAKVQRGEFPKGATLIHLYLGLPYGGGHTNLEYQGLMSALERYTDDLLFFSHLLVKDLREYGLKVVKENPAVAKGAATPLINDVDFSFAGELIPKPEEYQDWLKGFGTFGKGAWWERV